MDAYHGRSLCYCHIYSHGKWRTPGAQSVFAKSDQIYDSANEPTTVPKAGYLAAFQNLQFGVYTPQPYTPLNEFRCATCNGAMSLNEKQALKILLGTCTITILSFTWFASGVFQLF